MNNNGRAVRQPESDHDLLMALSHAVFGTNGDGIIAQIKEILKEVREMRTEMWTRTEHAIATQEHEADDREYREREREHERTISQLIEGRQKRSLDRLLMWVGLGALAAAVALDVITAVHP